MARLTVRDIWERIQNGQVDDLTSGANKSQLKRLIRNESFKSDLIKELWKIRELRWDITRYQQLPTEIVSFIIDHASDRSKRHISSAVFKELLERQTLVEDQYREIDYKLTGSNEYFTAWSSKPIEMFEFGDFDGLLKLIKNDSVNEALFTKTMVAIAEEKSETLDQIVDNSLKAKNYLTVSVLNSLAKRVFFNDELIDKIKKKFGKTNYPSFMEKVVIYKNCSDNKRAKYFLEKY